MNKILLVENDRQLLASIKTILQNNCDVEIFTACTLKTAFSILSKHTIDLVLLDRLLDDGDGFEILEFVADISPHTKVIILSNLRETDQRIRGLESGADLYLSKPFNKEELLLITSNYLNTEKLQHNEVLSFGSVEFSADTGLVTTPLFSKRLRRKEAQILKFLVVRKNQTVTRDQIIQGVWGSVDEIPTYSTIDAYIRKIRVSLNAYSHHLKTVRGFGYAATD